MLAFFCSLVEEAVKLYLSILNAHHNYRSVANVLHEMLAVLTSPRATPDFWAEVAEGFNSPLWQRDRCFAGTAKHYAMLDIIHDEYAFILRTLEGVSIRLYQDPADGWLALVVDFSRAMATRGGAWSTPELAGFFRDVKRHIVGVQSTCQSRVWVNLNNQDVSIGNFTSNPVESA